MARELESKEQIDKLFVYKKDLDENGIVYFLGTNFGTETWQNPSERGLIKLNSSGWDKGSINLMVGRTPDNSWATPTEGVWVIIDFGTSLYIKPNKYSLRDIFDCNHMLSWSLEGANEFLDWTPIKQHTNDQSMNHNGDKTHSWNINECHNYFSKFRIKMNDKNTGNNWYFHSTGFEIYGHLMGKQKYIKQKQEKESKNIEKEKEENNIQVLLQQIQELKTEAKQKENEMDQITKTNELLTEEIRKLKCANESLNSDNTIEPAETEQKTMRNELNSLKKEMNEMRKEINALKTNNQANDNIYNNNSETKEIFEFLGNQLNLPQYIDGFIYAGFTDFASFAYVTGDDLKDMGIKLGHRHRILKAITNGWRK
eukprot:336842_1